MNEIWVLGAGQLGAMLQHAAMPLALSVKTIDIHATEVPNLNQDDIVTVELEHWPDTAVTACLSSHPNFLNRECLKIFADRSIQKRLLDRLDLPHAGWRFVDHGSTTQSLHESLGRHILLKRCHGGYDGKGQHWLDSHNADEIPDSWLDQCIAEQKIEFDEEVSLIGARNSNGDTVFYPLTANLHHQGILLASVAPVKSLNLLQQRAQQMLTALMDELEYTGVMAMECFQVGNQLFINEIAPRVHNSGHWTQAGASISQFELHLRAITGLPMIKPMIKNTSVMLNTLGMTYNPDWHAVPGAEVYWYGKSVRPMRKLGHINFSIADHSQTIDSLGRLKPLLDDYYSDAIDWCIAYVKNEPTR
jgi:5-(carboxyamino)imidazole ribonucleotide synthase